jgi:hypothetical protein
MKAHLFTLPTAVEDAVRTLQPELITPLIDRLEASKNHLAQAQIVGLLRLVQAFLEEQASFAAGITAERAQLNVQLSQAQLELLATKTALERTREAYASLSEGIEDALAGIGGIDALLAKEKAAP